MEKVLSHWALSGSGAFQTNDRDFGCAAARRGRQTRGLEVDDGNRGHLDAVTAKLSIHAPFIAEARLTRCICHAGKAANANPVPKIASDTSSSDWPRLGCKATPVLRASQALMANDSP